MQIFLDSAIMEEAPQAAERGWVNGATTNPAILAQSAEKTRHTVRRPVFLPVDGTGLLESAPAEPA